MKDPAGPNKQYFIDALRQLIESYQDQPAPEPVVQTLTIWAADRETSLEDLFNTKPDLHRNTALNLERTLDIGSQETDAVREEAPGDQTLVAPTVVDSADGNQNTQRSSTASKQSVPNTQQAIQDRTIDHRSPGRSGDPNPEQRASGAAIGDHDSASAASQWTAHEPPTRAQLDTANSDGSNEELVRQTNNQIHSGLTHVPLKKHAEGGLGVVYLAADAELQRAVALKEIKGNQSQNREACDRFLFEAQVTARLEHPGIVPVYALGKHADGRPFYTMRFVEGETFSDAIKRLHQRRQQMGRLDWIEELRDLMHRFVDACHAIRFAHSHGFIHRDIKPLNIMLGSFGETLVVDWGLAKQQVAKPATDVELETRAFAINQQMPQIQSADHSIEGRAAGTPGFMSPEQMEGRIDELDDRSDIFSLGCTFYQLLTGGLPFAGKTLQEVSTKVLNNQYRLPRVANPAVPPALESICVKAIAHQPDQRYQCVNELIHDVESWLSDRPVSTYREPLLERSQRWFRRHRTIASLMAGGLLFASTVLAFALAIVNAEKKEKTLALKSEQVAKAQTRDALNTLTDSLLGELMARQAELTDADRQFFEQVVEQYDRFTELDGDSAEAIAFRGEGYLRVANLKRRLGDHDAAQAAYQQAIQLGDRLVELNPQSSESQYLLAQSHGGYGQLHSELGKSELALEHYLAAGDLFQALVDSNPADNQYRIELSSSLNNAGNMLWRKGEIDAAIEKNQAAIKTLADSPRDDLQTKLNRVQILNNYGGLLLKDQEKIDLAVDALKQATRLWEEVQNQIAEADSSNSAGFRITPQQRMNGATVRTSLASSLLKQRDVNGAIEQLEKTVEELSRLSSQYPAFASFQQQLARSQMQLGKCLDAVKDAEADGHFLEAEKVLESLTTRFPKRPAFQNDFAAVLETLATRAGNHEDDLTLERFRRSSRIRRALADADGENSIYHINWLATELKFANQLRKLGEYQSAAAAYRDLLETVESSQPSNTDPKIAQVQRLARFGLAESLGQAEKYVEAEVAWRTLAENRNDSKWRSFELQRIICLIRAGKTAEAIEAIKSLEELVRSDPSQEFAPVDFYDIACCYSLAVEMDQDQETIFLEQSVQYLRKAKDEGFFSEAMQKHFQTDADLRKVSRTPAFKSFLEETELNYNVGMDF